MTDNEEAIKQMAAMNKIPATKREILRNVRNMYFKEGSFSYHTNRVWLNLVILEEDSLKFRKKFEQILEPNNIFEVDFANSLIDFRRIARENGVTQGVDETIIALEKMGAFICKRTTNFGKEIYIEIHIDGYEDSEAHKMRDAYESLFRFIEDCAHYSSYLLTSTPDGSGRKKEAIFKGKYYSDSIYADTIDNTFKWRNGIKNGPKLYHRESNEEYSQQDYKDLAYKHVE